MNEPITWQPANSAPPPEAGVVDVWRCPTDLPENSHWFFKHYLSLAERERAADYRAPAKRNEFTIARGLLRVLLFRATEERPRELEFVSNVHGKPALLPEHNPMNVQFNVSHSHGLCLIALTRGKSVGIDIEYTQRENDCEALAQRFFSTAEVAALMAVPPEHRRRAFFTCWTRKEALLKATGRGITMPLDSFDVEFWPQERAGVSAIRFEPAGGPWKIFHLSPSDTHVATVAVEGEATLRCWEWAWQSTLEEPRTQ